MILKSVALRRGISTIESLSAPFAEIALNSRGKDIEDRESFERNFKALFLGQKQVQSETSIVAKISAVLGHNVDYYVKNEMSVYGGRH